MLAENINELQFELVNHKMATTLKEAFTTCCKYNHTSRTQVINELVQDYVDREIPRIEHSLEQHKVSREWLSLQTNMK